MLSTLHSATTTTKPLPSTSRTSSQFFPNLPQYRGRGKYAADRQKTSHPNDSCRKASYGHPSLFPGIFTLFCPHGICFGYEVMQSCESPMHPFNIFSVAPEVIVYNNVCKPCINIVLIENHTSSPRLCLYWTDFTGVVTQDAPLVKHIQNHVAQLTS